MITLQYQAEQLRELYIISYIRDGTSRNDQLMIIVRLINFIRREIVAKMAATYLKLFLAQLDDNRYNSSFNEMRVILDQVIATSTIIRTDKSTKRNMERLEICRQQCERSIIG